MRCPECGHLEDKVVDSRTAKDGEAIRRRRECLKCGKRFTTYEYIEKAPMMVVKKDGRREAYSREKLLEGSAREARRRRRDGDVREVQARDPFVRSRERSD
jgi:transcriptional repressor NrdR